MNSYCVYGLFRKSDNAIIYIGKGKSLSRMKDHRYRIGKKSHGNVKLQNKVLKMWRNGDDYTEIVIIDNLNNEKAIIIEKFFIAYCKLFDVRNLCNLTDGGEGCDGYTHTNEFKQKMRKRMLGNTRWTGRKHSDKTKKKISLVHLGKKVSKETREKLRLANIGRKDSLETRNKKSRSKLGEKNNKCKITESIALDIKYNTICYREAKNKYPIITHDIYYNIKRKLAWCHI